MTSLDRLDEPVRRYLGHALPAGARAGDRARLTMAGWIDVGRRLAFTAEQEFAGHEFTWRARAGWGRLRPLHVVDAYTAGAGSMRGALLGRVPFLRASGPDTTRSAAGRAAAESIWVPATLLPERGVTWRAEADDRIVARFAVGPEEPELRLRIGERGELRSVCLERWGDVRRRGYGYIPFGAEILAERRFGDVVVPSEVSVGWWYGTPRYTPFFEATILSYTSTVS